MDKESSTNRESSDLESLINKLEMKLKATKIEIPVKNSNVEQFYELQGNIMSDLDESVKNIEDEMPAFAQDILANTNCIMESYFKSSQLLSNLEYKIQQHVEEFENECEQLHLAFSNT